MICPEHGWHAYLAGSLLGRFVEVGNFIQRVLGTRVQHYCTRLDQSISTVSLESTSAVADMIYHLSMIAIGEQCHLVLHL